MGLTTKNLLNIISNQLNSVLESDSDIIKFNADYKESEIKKRRNKMKHLTPKRKKRK